jgi:hypothetical protein
MSLAISSAIRSSAAAPATALFGNADPFTIGTQLFAARHERVLFRDRPRL